MFNIIFFDEIDSTNIYAKKNILKLHDHDVIHAANQTQGRGRMLRSWMSSSDSLTFSIVLKSDYAIQHFDTLSLLSASAAFLAIKEYIPDSLSIKWPNDVYYKEEKLCGILLESVSLGEYIEGIVIGIGINVNNIFKDNPDIIRKPTSIRQIRGKEVPVKEVLEKLLYHFDNLMNDVLNGGNTYFDIIQSHNYLKGKKAFASMSSIEGEVEIIDVLKNNKLLVRKDNELYELSSGEITFHK